MDTVYENRLNQLSEEMQAVKEELVKTKSALEAYTMLPPNSVRIEGSPICTRFFINVSSIKQITTRAFAKELFKIVPTNTEIYAVDRGNRFGGKDGIFLLEAFIISYHYVYTPIIARELYNALLTNGYFDKNSGIRYISIINLERVADAFCVKKDIIDTQKALSGSDRGSVIKMLPSGELDESPAELNEIDPYYTMTRRESPVVRLLSDN